MPSRTPSSYRVFVVATAIFGLFGLGAGHPPEDDRRTTAEVDRFVDEKAEMIRGNLMGDFAKADRTRLLQTKEAVDTFLATILTLEDVAGRPVWEWWSLPAQEYRDGVYDPWRVRCPSDDGSGGIGDATTARRFSARMAWRAPSCEDYPLMLWVRGDVSPGSGDVVVRYYEPYLANRALAFPLHPERLIIRWSPSRLQVLDQGGARLLAEESAGQRDVVFNNPEFTYAVFDTLRYKLIPGSVPGRASAVERDDLPVGSWSVERFDGRPVRDVSLGSISPDRAIVSINQRPTRLHHESPIPFQIRRDYPDGRVLTETYVPAMEVEHLSGGREVSIAVERVNGRWSPAGVTVLSGGVGLFEASIDTADASEVVSSDERDGVLVREALDRLNGIYVAIDRHVSGARTRAYTVDEVRSSGGHLARARLKYNIYAASYGRNIGVMSMWLDEYRRLLADDGVDPRFFVYNVESMAQVAMDAIDGSWADRVVSGPLADAYEGCSSEDLAEHALRLVSQYRIGLAAVALDVLSRRVESAYAPWALSLGGELRRAWTAGELKPGSQYPYADLSARLTERVFEHVLTVGGAPAFAMEDAR